MPKDKKPTDRLLEMNNLFNDRFGSRTVLKSNELTERFGISLRQLRTDTDTLKSKGAPLEYDPQMRGWRYTERFMFTDSIPLSLDDVMQLRIATETLAPLAHLDGYRGLPEVVQKIQYAVRRWMREQSPTRAIYFDTPPRYEGTAHLSLFLRAIEEFRQISFDYHPFHAEKPKNVLFDPYFLRQYAQRWYVGGYSHDSSEGFVRTFPLERIVGTPNLVGFFHNKPKDYNPESYWHDIFGISRPPNAQPETVIIEFESIQGKYFLSKPFFEPFTILEDSSDRLIVRFTIVVNQELVAEIAQHGVRAKVLSPPSLIDNIKTFFQTALFAYE